MSKINNGRSNNTNERQKNNGEQSKCETLSLSLPGLKKQEFCRIAQLKGKKVSDILMPAIDEFIEKNPDKVTAKLIRKDIDAMEEKYNQCIKNITDMEEERLAKAKKWIKNEIWKITKVYTDKSGGEIKPTDDFLIRTMATPSRVHDIIKDASEGFDVNAEKCEAIITERVSKMQESPYKNSWKAAILDARIELVEEGILPPAPDEIGS